MASLGDYQPMGMHAVNVNEMKDKQIEIFNKDTTHFSKAVTFNTNT